MDFQNKEEWHFSFCNIFFRFRDICIMQIRKVMTSVIVSQKD